MFGDGGRWVCLLFIIDGDRCIFKGQVGIFIFDLVIVVQYLREGNKLLDKEVGSYLEVYGFFFILFRYLLQRSYILKLWGCLYLEE